MPRGLARRVRARGPAAAAAALAGPGPLRRGAGPASGRRGRRSRGQAVAPDGVEEAGEGGGAAPGRAPGQGILELAKKLQHQQGVEASGHHGGSAGAESGGGPSRHGEAWPPRRLREAWAREGLLRGCGGAAAAGAGSGPLRVAVLLSGGVDSSVALQLLAAAGHSCTAFYLQIWFQEDFRNFWGSCPWEEDLEYARAVCAQAGVPLEVVPMTDDYWAQVVADSIGKVKRGLTPNPDMLCNSRVKFGAFARYLDRRFPRQFDRIASGHYAHVEARPGPAGAAGAGGAALALSADAVKDQTYFLAMLSRAQLARALFPLGCLPKRRVREVAHAAGLANRDRKDSQGICFLGKVRFSEFVAEHLGTWPGLILEEESGAALGFHRGYWFHTIGQRTGLYLPDGPWYVVRKDLRMNALYVSKDYYALEKRRDAFKCGAFNWLVDDPPAHGERLECKVRHGAAMYGCRILYEAGGGAATVLLDGSDQGLAAGQYAVFYRGRRCVGSAVMLGGCERPTGAAAGPAALGAGA